MKLIKMVAASIALLFCIQSVHAQMWQPNAYERQPTHDAKPSTESQPQQQYDLSPVCYQELCLGDSIQKLSYPIVSDGLKEPNIGASVLPEASKASESIFVTDPGSRKKLAARGFAGGMTSYATGIWVTSQETLQALKNIRTLCGQPDKNAWIRTRTPNGKVVSLTYSSKTRDDGVSTYTLSEIRISYPDVKSSAETEALLEKAQVSIKTHMVCRHVGSYLDIPDYSCLSMDDKQRVRTGLSGGSVVLTIDRNTDNPTTHINMSQARAHPNCKTDINF